MAGLDSYKNGIIFGAIFGLIVILYALSPGSYLAFLAAIFTSISGALVSFSWWPAILSSSVMTYVLSIISGGVIGGIIDAK